MFSCWTMCFLSFSTLARIFPLSPETGTTLSLFVTTFPVLPRDSLFSSKYLCKNLWIRMLINMMLAGQAMCCVLPAPSHLLLWQLTKAALPVVPNSRQANANNCQRLSVHKGEPQHCSLCGLSQRAHLEVTQTAAPFPVYELESIIFPFRVCFLTGTGLCHDQGYSRGE